MILGLLRWTKILARWASTPESPEKRLIVAVLAQAISDEQDRVKRSKYSLDLNFGFSESMFEAYCRMVGLNPDFVREQVSIAHEHKGTAHA